MDSKAFTHDVFLSHSAKDKAAVRAVAERLRADGLSMCLYQRYHPSFGCQYPQDMTNWWHSEERLSLLTKIDPRVCCQDIVCSRFEANIPPDLTPRPHLPTG